MMLFTDKALAAAGLNFQLAKALLAPAEDEVLVHIHQVLDGPPVPQASHDHLDRVTHRAGSHRDSSLGIASTSADYESNAVGDRSSGSQTAEAKGSSPQLVYTPSAEQSSSSTTVVYTLRPVGDSSRSSQPPLMRDLAGRADTLAEVERDARVLAATCGAELHPAPRGEYTLVSRTGTTTHESLSAALKSLKPPVEYLLDRLDAVTVKVTPAAPTEPAVPLAGAFGMRPDAEVPVLPEGASLNAIRYVAHLLGCTVQADKKGHVLLTGQFGSRVFGSTREARLALNKRAWT